ncbi:hypothetical protein ACWPKS_04795 [Coraliomargarita sp. W4R72]
MKLSPIRCVFLLLASALLGNTLSAQEVPQVSASISCVTLEGRIEELKFASSGQVRKINIYAGSRSKVLKYNGPNNLTFFREEASPTVEGELIRVPVGQVSLDGKHSRYLLFFSTSSGAKEHYQIFAIPDSTDTFKAGTYRFLNLAPFKVALKIGETKEIIAEKAITDVAGDFEQGNHYQTIMFSLPDGQEPVSAYQGRVFFSEHLRMLYIIQPKGDPKTGKIKMIGIPDRVMAKP